MPDNFKLVYDVDRVRAKALTIFMSKQRGGILDVPRWAKRSKVSIPSIRAFLQLKSVKFETAAKIIGATGLPIEDVVQINGKRIA